MYFLFGHFGIHDMHYLRAFLCLKSIALLEPVYAIKLRRWDLEKARKAANELRRNEWHKEGHREGLRQKWRKSQDKKGWVWGLMKQGMLHG